MQKYNEDNVNAFCVSASIPTWNGVTDVQFLFGTGTYDA